MHGAWDSLANAMLRLLPGEHVVSEETAEAARASEAAKELQAESTQALVVPAPHAVNHFPGTGTRSQPAGSLTAPPAAQSGVES